MHACIMVAICFEGVAAPPQSEHLRISCPSLVVVALMLWFLQGGTARARGRAADAAGRR